MSESRTSTPQSPAAVDGRPRAAADESGPGPLRTVPLVPESVVTEDPAEVAHRIVEEVLAAADLTLDAPAREPEADAVVPESSAGTGSGQPGASGPVATAPDVAVHPALPVTVTMETSTVEAPTVEAPGPPRVGVPGSELTGRADAAGATESVAGASPRRWLLVSLLAAAGIVVSLVLGMAALRGVVEGQLALVVPALV